MVLDASTLTSSGVQVASPAVKYRASDLVCYRCGILMFPESEDEPPGCFEGCIGLCVSRDGDVPLCGGFSQHRAGQLL